jgi:CheY-like chemotaxis protein
VPEDKPPAVAADAAARAREQQAGAVLAEAETGGGEDEKAKETFRQRVILLAEDDPSFSEVILKKLTEKGANEVLHAETFKGVESTVTDFINRVEKGELDQRILTMIADLEYPYQAGGPADPSSGMRGIEFARKAVAEHNQHHPEQAVILEVVLNSSVADPFRIKSIKPDVVSKDKEKPVEAFLNREEATKIREALEKRFVLLTEHDPRVRRSLRREFGEISEEGLFQVYSLEEVKKAVDDFVYQVEKGELDKTILTMITDLEYPNTEDGAPDPENGLNGIAYMREAVAKHNDAYPDKPLQTEVILNSTISTQHKIDVEAVSPDKSAAVKTLLEMIKK